MEVILLEKVRNLGALGEKVNVSNGYGRNYLVPQGKAVYATAANIKKFEVLRVELEKQQAARIEEAQAKQKALLELGVVRIVAKAGDEGKLFGSIGTRDIADAITKAGVEITKSHIHLPTGLLRHLGEYDIEIDLHSDIDISIKIAIVAEE